MNALVTSVEFKNLRIPYVPALVDLGVDNITWKVLQETIFPNAKTLDSIVMALTYCRARKLDIMKRPVHIVPMYSSAAEKMIDTVWPSIAELRTTAFRTGQYAGIDGAEFGPMIVETFKGTRNFKNGKSETREVTVKYPEWCQMTVLRDLGGRERRFVGPKVYWREAYARWGDTDVPNDMWVKRPVGQIEKCTEAAATRRAFPEEVGNEYTAEEMEGQRLYQTETPAERTPPTPPKPPAVIEHKPAVAMETIIDQETGEIIERGAEQEQQAAKPPVPPKPPIPPKASASSKAFTRAELPTDFESIRRLYVEQAKSVKDGSELEGLWTRLVEPHYDSFMPPDQEDIVALHRTRSFELDR